MNVTLLNMDGAYHKQSFYRKSSYQWLDFDSMQNMNLFCEKNMLEEMKKSVIQRPNEIYFLGSGNYHYLSYVLQSQIDKPYSLVLFDHHTDTLPSPSEELISCGSWVLESLNNLPMLQKAFIIGVTEDAIQHIPRFVQDKVVLYTERFLQSNFTTIVKSIIKAIPTNTVYISMDKDVLDKNDAVTNWDHGSLRLKQLLQMIKPLFQQKSIVGADVCGEFSVKPSNEYEKEVIEAVAKNNRVNGLILESVRWWSKKGKQSSVILHA